MPFDTERIKTEIVLFHFQQTDGEIRSRPAVVVDTDEFGVADLFVFFHRTDAQPLTPDRRDVCMADPGTRQHYTWTRQEDR